MTHDTRVVDWLGHSGASIKTGRSGGEIHSLSLGSGRCTSLEALVCSGVSQAVVSTSDWIILYTSKANWTYDTIITEISKKL